MLRPRILIGTAMKKPKTPPDPPRGLTSLRSRDTLLFFDGLAAELVVAAAGLEDVVVDVVLVLSLAEEDGVVEVTEVAEEKCTNSF